MKSYFVYTTLLFTLASLSLSSCRTQRVYRRPVFAQNSSLPPGQAKKITGEKSAKRYAPGQQKKN